MAKTNTIRGEPIEVVDIVNDYAEFMKKTNIKKLFINAEPGSILIGPQREFCRSWKNQEEITVKGNILFKKTLQMR